MYDKYIHISMLILICMYIVPDLMELVTEPVRKHVEYWTHRECDW